MKKLARVAIVALISLVLLVGLAGAQAPLFQGLPTVRLVVDGQELQTDVPAVILGGRTMVPLKAVAQALGAAAEWDPATYTVTITPARDPHVLSTEVYVRFVEQTDGWLLVQPVVDSSDPDYERKNQELATSTQNIITALESCAPPPEWRTAHYYCVAGLQYMKAGEDVANQVVEATEKGLRTKKMADLEEAKRLCHVLGWLGEQMIAQHDALHAEFVRLTGREPNHQIIWEDEEQ